MHSDLKKKIFDVVEKRAMDSAQLGVPLNAAMRARERRDIEQRLANGEIAVTDMDEYLRPE